MKLAKALFVLALAAFVAAPAFAETQNVKVSGSLDVYAFNRTNYDLTGGNDAGTVPTPTTVPAGGGTVGSLGQRSDGDQFITGITQIEVAADLTDNVSTVVNLVNQRDWNGQVDSATVATTEQFDVTLDLAYVQMKEIFYSPLTLTVGRQDIWFGRGFLIGNNNAAWDPQGTMEANEYSATTAFDAIRATLDFNPWTVDFVYSKINEGSNNAEDDTDLYVANVNYKFAEYNAVAEAIWVTEANRSTVGAVPASGSVDSETHTIGARVQFDPINQITLGGELYYQFGSYKPTVAIDRDRSAWGWDLFGTYRWVDYTWKPELTLEYVGFSGEGSTVASTEEYNGWNGLYRGKFWTAYADFREFQYSTGDASDQPATTNEQFIQVKGAIKPLEDLLLEASFTWLWTDESVIGRNDDLGYEIDLQATYDYTEDVSFGLLAAWYVPGDFYSSPNDAHATDIVSSVKVTF